jgi:hypothetical protein
MGSFSSRKVFERPSSLKNLFMYFSNGSPTTDSTTADRSVNPCVV